MIGKIIYNQYRIIDFLGGGGFGKVYLAQDISSSSLNENWCVVKQLQPIINPLNSITVEEAKRLFYEEAQTLEILGKHDQIPRLFNFFEENKNLYLVEEFIDGYELSEEIDKGILNEYQIYNLLVDILKILKFIQEENVIHRDISPDNLIRRKQDNKLVLIDFGAVKKLVTDVDGKQRRSKTIAIGKEGYMPDEQANGRPSFCSDVYALGVICIQACIGGRIPLKDNDSGEIVWRSYSTNISFELADILDKMTRCFFRERYQSASEVLIDLNKLSYKYTDMETNKSIDFKFNYTEKWYICGNKLKNKKHHEEAVLLYKKVLEINSCHFGAIFNTGICYGYLNLYNEAIKVFDSLLELKPNSVNTLLHKGRSRSIRFLSGSN